MDKQLIEVVKKVAIEEFNKNPKIVKAAYSKLNFKILTLKLIEENLECRDRRLVTIRQTIMTLVHDLRDKYTLQQLGSIFNKDHATSLYSINQISNLKYSSKEYSDYYSRCSERLSIFKKCGFTYNASLTDRAFIKALSVVRNYGDKAVRELINKFY